MHSIKIGSVNVGSGPVKVLVSLSSKEERSLSSRARTLDKEPVDILEWRLDAFKTYDVDSLSHAYDRLRISTTKPILCTLRTSREGGAATLDRKAYKKLLLSFMEQAKPDAIDIEFGRGDVKELFSFAKECSIPIVSSFHDFEKTPKETVLFQKLSRMYAAGADILKIAVMPKSERDVLTVFSTLLRAKEAFASPIIAIAMGPLGILTRVAGGAFGSAATFAGFGSTSAPGQLNLEETRALLLSLNR